MLPILEEMRKAVSCYVAVQAAGFRCTDEIPYFMGLPQFPLELDPLQLTRGEMADYARRARDIGANYIGACCGVAASHIRSMAEALGRTTMGQRQVSRVGHPSDPRAREGWHDGEIGATIKRLATTT